MYVGDKLFTEDLGIAASSASGVKRYKTPAALTVTQHLARALVSNWPIHFALLACVVPVLLSSLSCTILISFLQCRAANHGPASLTSLPLKSRTEQKRCKKAN